MEQLIYIAATQNMRITYTNISAHNLYDYYFEPVIRALVRRTTLTQYLSTKLTSTSHNIYPCAPTWQRLESQLYFGQPRNPFQITKPKIKN